MELTQIRYFLEVARSQHVTKSAERLHIAQSALSQSIKRLEGDLGVPLFVQRGRNIVLTEYGKYLQARLSPLLDSLDAVPAELAAMAKTESQTIRLNVLAASTLITEAIIEFKQEHGSINFQMMQNSGSDLYDIGITTKLIEKAPEKNEFIFTEQIFLAVPEQSEYAALDHIRLSDVRDAGFISLTGSRQLRRICNQLCAQAGFSQRVIFESDNPAAVRNMIAAHLGVGFWPQVSWGRLDSRHVRLLPIREPDCRRDLIVTCNHNKSENACVDEFFSFLRSYMKTRFDASAK